MKCNKISNTAKNTHMEEKRRDYAADGIGNDDWRADFDRVLARSRAALMRAQDNLT